MWSLQVPLHRYTNIASVLPSLARCIVREEICWGETVVFEGEYCHIPGYWEWAEDTLARIGPISTKIPEVAHQECSNAVPRPGNSFTPLVMSLEKCKGKGPQLLKKTPTKQVYNQDCQGGKGSFQLSIAAHISKKRSSQGESNRSHEDRYWKKVRPHSDKSRDVDLAVVEIHDSVDSPSMTLIDLIKKKSGESVSSPNPIKSPSTGQIEKEATSAPCDRVIARSSSDLQKHPTVVVSVFDGKKVILSYRKMFISNLWIVIRGKLSGSNIDYASSLKEEVQAQSALHDKDMEAARKELSIAVGERLSNSMLEEHEKIEKVSSVRQSLSKVKEKIEKLQRKEKDLEILLATTEKEVEEAKLGVSTVEKDFDACNDVDLLNSNDLINLERKEERLEAMHQDLINYKLLLD
ncbi:hypothetical protein HAX54_011448 [Datura stramonium]|uniref:Uncharacterized protein n=1 Tax=Datura stramonium TaxID=4076 RepID=A0ABS8Y6I1_DATST|nr:hypothetical protein [Datura stramonium]